MRRISWQRVLISLLLIANAFPFTLDPSNRSFSLGLVFVILGLAVLAAPLPDGRSFTFLDGLRVAGIALCLAFFAFTYGRAPTGVSIALAVCGTVPLFIPWRFREAKHPAREEAPPREKGWYER